MMARMHTLFAVFALLTLAKCDVHTEQREELLKKEASMRLGGNITLTEMEQLVNSLLLQKKHAELAFGFENPGLFNPAVHFFHAKASIEQSEVFKFIQQLPKGGSLHSHDTADTSHEYMLELTYTEGLYGCIKNERLMLKFFKGKPPTDCEWNTLANMRAKDPNFDAYVKTQISILVEDPHKEYPDINAAWTKFQQTFGTVDGLLLYLPIFKQYLYRIFQELYDDNVMFIEMRTTLPICYDLDGTTLNEIEVAGIIKQVADNFLATHEDFQYVKIIYAPSRRVNLATMDKYIEVALELRQKYGNFVVGFDLVGQEDLGQELIYFIEQLELLKTTGINLVFHAGETNWHGFTDNNIIDALLLGTKRIGHGYAITKHPELLQIVKDNNIAIEVSPISNQVLKLVDDMRNHPANFLIAGGYPMVICNDNPAFWDSKGLSHDWYEAFMGFTNKDDGLNVLKQLALNTYRYSLLSDSEKVQAITQWELKWNRFIESQYYAYFVDSLKNGASILRP